jgi:hypothetical protein
VREDATRHPGAEPRTPEPPHPNPEPGTAEPGTRNLGTRNCPLRRNPCPCRSTARRPAGQQVSRLTAEKPAGALPAFSESPARVLPLDSRTHPCLP